MDDQPVTGGPHDNISGLHSGLDQQQQQQQQQQLQQKQNERIETSDDDSSEEINIARRTRSHVRIDDAVLKDSLDFPDVDANLYQNPDSVTDPEYKNFLSQCFSYPLEQSNDTHSDDNDPAYVYNDDVLSHGWKFDLDEELNELQQRIQLLEETDQQEEEGQEQQLELEPHDQYQEQLGHKTLTELLPRPLISQALSVPQAEDEGVGQAASGCVIVDASFDPNNTDLISSFADQKSAVASLSSVPGFKSPHKSGFARRRLEYFDSPEFQRVLNQQLRQQVQLLTQNYLVASCMAKMQNEAAEARSHLNAYMKIFRNRRKPSNLLPAIKLLNDFVAPKELKSSVRLSWRQLPVPDVAQRIIMQHPNMFPYVDLLPQVAFSVLPEKLVTKKAKIIFTPNEDKLLALALKEFENEYSQYAYIASLLMAAKTKMQINNHVKNMKRSALSEENPIRLFLQQGQLPHVDLNSGSRLREIAAEQSSRSLPAVEEDQPAAEETPVLGHDLPFAFHDHHHHHHQHTDIMNMELDDLMAASTTISKNNNILSTNSNNNNSHNNNNNHSSSNNSNNNNNGTTISEKNIRNQKLRRSMVELMSHKFVLSQEMGDLMVEEYLRLAREKLNERDNLHLLQLMTELMRTKGDQDCARTYQEIHQFLITIKAPFELRDRLVLFLDLDQASKCGLAPDHLHWMRFFQFLQHVELHHDNEMLEKKLVRLVDAIQKEDSHKIRLATANLINKHPLLRAEFEALSPGGKPHASLFANDEDFDDITEPFANYDNNQTATATNGAHEYEHFDQKLTQHELNFASQACPCRCHFRDQDTQVEPQNDNNNQQQQLSQHCNRCNLKFVKGRIYLVSKIRSTLAEWTHVDRDPPDEPEAALASGSSSTELPSWTFEEDKEILEFCRAKTEQNENVSFDPSTFEELAARRLYNKKSAKQITERFNHLMEMYRRDAAAPPPHPPPCPPCPPPATTSLDTA